MWFSVKALCSVPNIKRKKERKDNVILKSSVRIPRVGKVMDFEKNSSLIEI